MPGYIETSTPGLRLRHAGEEDVALILQLIRELAEYERLSHEVVADEATLARWLFGDRPVAEVVLAELEGRTAGFTLFFANFSTFLGRPGLYVEDLYVRPEHRTAGIGRALLSCVGRLAHERGYGRVEWSVLDWNEPAIGFYRRLGAVAMDEWTVYRVTGPALEALAASFPAPAGETG